MENEAIKEGREFCSRTWKKGFLQKLLPKEDLTKWNLKE